MTELTNVGIVGDVSEKRSCKIIDIENAVLSLAPVCFVSEGVNANMLEVRISWQPLLGPVVIRMFAARPRLPLSTSNECQQASIHVMKIWRAVYADDWIFKGKEKSEYK